MRILLTLVTILYLISATCGREECDKKSDRWDNETYRALDGKCEHLTYNEQFCIVDRNKLECMRQRARMHDVSSCSCYREAYNCMYIEVCAFSDPKFKCSRDYLCSVGEDGKMTCTAPNLLTYTNHCIHGFIHCTDCGIANLIYEFTETYKDQCQENLTAAFGTNVTIYFIDRMHYGNTNTSFLNITVLVAAEGDEHNPCIRGDDYPDLPNNNSKDWKIVVPVLIVFILVVLFSYGGWRFYQIRKKENKKIDELWDRNFNRLTVQFTPDTAEPRQITSTDNKEVVDPIPPEGIPPPPETRVDEDISVTLTEDPPAAPVENIMENQSESGEQLSSQNLDITGYERLHSFDNTSYTYERLIRPSVSSAGSAFSGYSSKFSPELLEAPCNERIGSTSTISGYSMKNLSGPVGSVERRSSNDIPHSDTQPENHHLHAISEGDVSEPLNAAVSPDQERCNQNEMELSHSNSLLCDSPRNICNPTYLI